MEFSNKGCISEIESLKFERNDRDENNIERLEYGHIGWGHFRKGKKQHLLLVDIQRERCCGLAWAFARNARALDYFSIQFNVITYPVPGAVHFILQNDK